MDEKLGALANYTLLHLLPEFPNEHGGCRFEGTAEAGIEINGQHFVIDGGGWNSHTTLMNATAIGQNFSPPAHAEEEMWHYRPMYVPRTGYKGYLSLPADAQAMKAVWEGGLAEHFVSHSSFIACKVATPEEISKCKGNGGITGGRTIVFYLLGETEKNISPETARKFAEFLEEAAAIVMEADVVPRELSEQERNGITAVPNNPYIYYDYDGGEREYVGRSHRCGISPEQDPLSSYFSRDIASEVAEKKSEQGEASLTFADQEAERRRRQQQHNERFGNY